MVTSAGEIKLLDFGLAKLVEVLPLSSPVSTSVSIDTSRSSEGIFVEDVHLSVTRTGSMLGTPLYMAPESWRSEPATPQTDVYSLGALLYELCCGRPPHHAQNALSLGMQVTTQDAPPLAQVAPSVDARLAVVVDRCLRRDPAERFASGQEVLAALERIESAAPAISRRMLFIGTALLAVVLLSVVGTSIQRVRQAKKQAELSQQLGQEVKEMELFMRAAYGLPLHDVSREQAVLRSRMDLLRSRLQHSEKETAAPLHYALGRAHFMLREYQPARAELEASWRAGFRTPAASYALGQVFGELYRIQFDEARRESDKATRDKRMQQLVREYQEPALQYLNQARGGAVAMDSPAYLEGLLAFYRRNYAEAEPAALRAQAEAPWLSEAQKLLGDVYREQAIDALGRGDHTQARTIIAKALRHHSAAAEMARSDADTHIAVALDHIRSIEIDDATGSTTADPVEKARAACEHATAVDPRLAIAYETKAWVLWRWGIGEQQRGRDPTSILLESIAAAEKGLELSSGSSTSSTYYGLGVANYVLAWHFKETDARKALQYTERSIESYKKAVAILPTAAWYQSDLGAAYTMLMELQALRGRASTDTLSLAEASLRRAIELDRLYSAPYANLTILYVNYTQSQLDHGSAPDRHLEEAIRYGLEAIKLNENDFESLNALVMPYLMRARFQRLSGGAATAALNEAQVVLERSIKINSNNGQVHVLNGELALLQAEQALALKQPLEDFVSAGRQALKRAEALGGQSAQPPLLLAQLELVKARELVEKRQLEAARERFAFAQTTATLALDRSPKNGEVHETLARIAWHRAAAELVGRRAAANPTLRAQIDAGLSHCEEALRLQPHRATTLATSGALHLLLARLTTGIDQQSTAARAVAALEEVPRQNPLLSREYAQLLKEARELMTALSRQQK